MNSKIIKRGPTLRQGADQCYEDWEGRGLAKTTISVRRYTLNKFIRHEEGEGREYWSEITPGVFSQYARHLLASTTNRGTPLSDRAAHDAQAIVKSVLTWGDDHRWPVSERLRHFHVVKAAAAFVPMPPDAAVATGLEVIDWFYDPEHHPGIAAMAAAGAGRFFPVRAKAWMCLALSTGARGGELSDALLANYDKQAGYLFLAQSKTGEPRRLKINAQAKKHLDSWLRVRPKASATDHLFVSETGERLTRLAVSRQFRRYWDWARAQGIDLPKFNLHSLRHVAATSLARENLDDARRILGHKHISTTQRYLHGIDKRVEETHEKADPLERILTNSKAKTTTEATRKRKVYAR